MATTSSRPSTVFYWYTVASALILTVGMPVVALIPSSWVQPSDLRDNALSTALFVSQVLLTTVAVGWWLERWRRGRPGLPWWALLVAPIPAVGALVVLLTHIAAQPPDGADPVVMISLVTVMTGLVPLHATLRWFVAIPSAIALAALAGLAGMPVPISAPVGSYLVAIVAMLRSSLWLLELVAQIDRARQMEGRLALAEERLRFSRDLHDVMGRDLSSIAVTAELVTQLAERGDPRAAEHARSISTMARSSLADVRALVRGYRDVDLASELQGTLSLLRSAGIRTHLHGEAADVPAEHAEAATWVLREAGTNLLRHADASTVTIDLGPESLTVTNDGAHETVPSADGHVTEGTGLRGLRERVGPARTLRAHQDGGTFSLALHFTPEHGPPGSTPTPPSPVSPRTPAPAPSDGGSR